MWHDTNGVNVQITLTWQQLLDEYLTSRCYTESYSVYMHIMFTKCPFGDENNGSDTETSISALMIPKHTQNKEQRYIFIIFMIIIWLVAIITMTITYENTGIDICNNNAIYDSDNNVIIPFQLCRNNHSKFTHNNVFQYLIMKSCCYI